MRAELAARLSWGSLHRLWQLLLKGLEDVRIAPDPHEAATMALLRLIHAADMPDPSALAAMLAGGGAVAPAPPTLAPSRPPEPKSSLPSRFRRAGRGRRASRASNCSASSCATMSGWSASRRASWCSSR